MTLDLSSPLLFSRKEAARRLSISTRALDLLLHSGQIDSIPVGRRRLIHRDELARFAAKGSPGPLAGR